MVRSYLISPSWVIMVETHVSIISHLNIIDSSVSMHISKYKIALSQKQFILENRLCDQRAYLCWESQTMHLIGMTWKLCIPSQKKLWWNECVSRCPITLFSLFVISDLSMLNPSKIILVFHSHHVSIIMFKLSRSKHNWPVNEHI